MNRGVRSFIGILGTALLLVCAASGAGYAKGKPKDKGDKGKHAGWKQAKKADKKDRTPPGWKMGLKKGWKDEMPPGWKNWTKEKKKIWHESLRKARDEIKAKAVKKGWKASDVENAGTALEFTARKGVPVGHAKRIVGECIGQGLTGEATLRVGISVSKGVGKKADFNILGPQVVEKLRAGYRGEKLAAQIHTMTEQRHQAKKKIQGEKTGKENLGKGDKQEKDRPGKEKQKKEKSDKPKGKGRGSK